LTRDDRGLQGGASPRGPAPGAEGPTAPRSPRRAVGLVVLAACVAASAVVLVVVEASRRAAPPDRCGPGFVALETRCCGVGQRLVDGGRCEGRPTSCGPEHRATEQGCEPIELAVAVPAATLALGPSDWEAQGVVSPRTLQTRPFWIDRFEISVGAYARCAQAGACPGPVPRGDTPRAALLSLPQASALCRYRGGRLPSDDEWTVAAMGAAGRRYPWGDTGAVCVRAAFGLSEGPCARGAVGPDTVGAHPLGRSPEGAHDLAGNVAEWTLSELGAPRLRGGSYASALATELRGWRASLPRAGAPGSSPLAGEAGGRCVYDAPPPARRPR
jgi:formylglycine-generating enzyme